MFKWIIEHDHAALLLHEHHTSGSGLSEKLRVPFLIHTAERGQLRLVEILLKNSHECKKGVVRAVRAAAAAGHLAVVERLLVSQTTVNAATIVAYREAAIHAAAEAGQIGILKKLIYVDSHSADLYLQKALYIAAARGQCELVALLLSENPASVASTNPLGQNALHIAAEAGYLEVVETLLGAQANANAEDSSGQGALHLAARYGHLAVVERLLAAKADVHHRDTYGRTSLHHAATSGSLEIVERLLVAGVDVSRQDVEGQTAIDVAKQWEHRLVVRRLLSAQSNLHTTNWDDRVELGGEEEKRDVFTIDVAADYDPTHTSVRCPTCHREFSGRDWHSNLKRHQKTVHFKNRTTVPSIYCYWGSCNSSYIRKADLLEHIQHHVRATFAPSCSCLWKACGSTFWSYELLMSNVESHIKSAVVVSSLRDFGIIEREQVGRAFSKSLL